MSQVRYISKAQARILKNVKVGYSHFNPRVFANGKWGISDTMAQIIEESEFDWILSLPSESYTEITKATDLSDVFNSNHLDQPDIDDILIHLDHIDSYALTRRDIRFRGSGWTSISDEARSNLINKGFILIESDLIGSAPDGQEVVTPNQRPDGILEYGEFNNPGRKIWAAMYHPDQTNIEEGQITNTPANYIEGALPAGWVSVGSEVSREALVSELNSRGKTVL